MYCPACEARNGVEIVMHSDGYAKNLLECSSCGAVWSNIIDEVKVLFKQLDSRA